MSIFVETTSFELVLVGSDKVVPCFALGGEIGFELFDGCFKILLAAVGEGELRVAVDAVAVFDGCCWSVQVDLAAVLRVRVLLGKVVGAGSETHGKESESEVS